MLFNVLLYALMIFMIFRMITTNRIVNRRRKVINVLRQVADEQAFFEAADQLIQSMEKILSISLSDDEELRESLLNHIGGNFIGASQIFKRTQRNLGRAIRAVLICIVIGIVLHTSLRRFLIAGVFRHNDGFARRGLHLIRRS